MYPKLDLDYHMCHVRKINRTISAPGGAEMTNTSALLGQSTINVALALDNSTSKPAVHIKYPMITRSRDSSPKFLKKLGNMSP